MEPTSPLAPDNAHGDQIARPVWRTPVLTEVDLGQVTRKHYAGPAGDSASEGYQDTLPGGS